MDSSIEVVEGRLKSFLVQLKAEYGILNRITYKNKNQHRRCAYFQYLLKVKRDLKLLQSAQLEEILSSSINIITGARPRQKVQLLESLKRSDGSKPTFLERLVGIARLLSQIVEPMLKAATEISILLARSFFMAFSLTVIALLARIRVLVQQILLDVVTVFNIVSSLSQTKQSIKITEKGCEVFREYYPVNNDTISLVCVWEKDKFVLHENVKKGESSRAEENNDPSAALPGIQYHSIEAFLGDDESLDSDDPSSASIAKHENNPVSASLVIDSSTSSQPDPKRQKLQHGHKSKVAFLSIQKPPPSKNASDDFQLKRTENKPDEEEDPFFTLLTGGSSKTSLF
ncbi:uncharacterized protein LOC124914854 [Impatiens glandulifera]|uniref:uncharacterized protein LOC124914854 n=1 Tax=Impatiens glandulifera TaxID=253017 RepID=UPI001FB12D8C|nr:uncharacterized protein LOC124914854 [Impatiens glandulifera]